MGVRWHFVLRYPDKMLQKLLHHLILTKSVYHVNTGISPANLYDPVKHIKVCADAELPVQILHVVSQTAAHFSHKKTPFPPF